MNLKHIIFLTALLSTMSFSLDAKEYTFATHLKPPVSNRVAEVYTEVFTRMGQGFTYEQLPGLRVLRDVNAGNYDGDMSRISIIKEISSENIANYRIINEGLFKMELVIITRDDKDIRFPSWDEANKGSVSFIRGSERIRKNIHPENRTAVGEASLALKLVVLGRVDSAVLFRLVAIDLLNKDVEGEFNHLKIHNIPIDHFTHFGFMHKKNASIIPEIERQLRDMKEDGSYHKIINSYQNLNTHD